MNWDKFCDWYAANFRALTESDGLTEWHIWVVEISEPTLRNAAQQLIENYAGEVNSGRRPGAPRLSQLQAVYYRELADEKQRRQAAAYGGGSVCGVCGGSGTVLVLAPDRDNKRSRLDGWPRHPREIAYSAWNSNSPEAWPCPQCRRGEYRGEWAKRLPEIQRACFKCDTDYRGIMMSNEAGGGLRK